MNFSFSFLRFLSAGIISSHYDVCLIVTIPIVNITSTNIYVVWFQLCVVCHKNAILEILFIPTKLKNYDVASFLT